MGRALRTPENEELFLEALAEGFSVRAAAKTIGAGRRTVYDWRDADPEFKKRWDEAIEDGTDTLEDAARARALDTSDTLLIFTLKARRPEKYRENVNLNHSGTITVTATNFAVIDAKAEEVKLIGEGNG
jgi:transposase